MTKDEEKTLMRVIGGTANGGFEHASALVQVIDKLSTDAQVEAFALILERFRHPSYRNGIHIDGPGITKEREAELKQMLSGMIDGVLAYVISVRMPADDAGNEIHRVIMQRPTEEERAWCLAWVLCDQCVPYAPIPQSKTTLSAERYTTLQNEMVTELARLRTVQRFAKDEAVLGDLVLSVVESHKEREKKLALFVYFIQNWRKKWQ